MKRPNWRFLPGCKKKPQRILFAVKDPSALATFNTERDLYGQEGYKHCFGRPIPVHFQCPKDFAISHLSLENLWCTCSEIWIVKKAKELSYLLIWDSHLAKQHVSRNSFSKIVPIILT